nr:hypothetical protein [Tanacetum cinerariifolium]
METLLFKNSYDSRWLVHSTSQYWIGINGISEELVKEEARQEQERYNLEKALELQRQLDQRKESVPKEIDWNDPQNQGGYKQSYFKGIKYEDIRPLFERIWDQVHTFVPKNFEIEREVMKRAGFDLQQGSSKKQRFKNLHIFLLVGKVCPRTPATLKMMLERKLQADQWREMCYHLLKLMMKQLRKQ